MRQAAPRALVIGCGYLGLRVAERLTALGFAVTGTSRSRKRLEAIRAGGAEAAELDLGAAGGAPVWDVAYGAVVYCASPARAEDRALVFRDGPCLCRELLGRNPPERFVYISSTGVYHQRDGSEVDEASPAASEEPQHRLILEAEAFLLAPAAGSPAIVVRLGGLYGPGRSPLTWLRDPSFRTRLRSSGGAYMNWIHIDDAAQAVAAAAVRGVPGELYLAVDGTPRLRSAIYSLAAQLSGAEAPQLSSDSGDRGRRCRNRKLVEELGVELRYPDVDSGLRALASEGAAGADPPPASPPRAAGG